MRYARFYIPSTTGEYCVTNKQQYLWSSKYPEINIVDELVECRRKLSYLPLKTPTKISRFIDEHLAVRTPNESDRAIAQGGVEVNCVVMTGKAPPV